MKTTSLALLLAVACTACVTDEDDKGAVNPSDLAYIGTGLAVVSSAGVDDIFDDDDDNSSFNSSFNSSNPNSSFNSSNSSNGTDPWDLDCDATLTVSGALNETFADATGCSGGSGGGTTQALSWIWGLETQYQLRFEDAPIRSASDTTDFTTEVLFRPFVLGGDDPSTGWLTTCAVSLSSSEGYTDGRGDQNAIWTGTAICPDPAIPVEETGDFGGDFMAVDGDPLSIESFSFTTPYPTAL